MFTFQDTMFNKKVENYICISMKRPYILQFIDPKHIDAFLINLAAFFLFMPPVSMMLKEMLV